ncbi:Polyisoprenoid-binding protein YceI [Chitinophaga sp. CF118]|uniref:YceI family protein n=1 Tax=Chitinophaga sp. CF118 TaxID=1884367 RepID=UPI0008E5A18A|nr:YceI family protein [Chitinophaga sp. CF118]SFE04631.1 Polyisoprenoid-binding protein YceI [Chitinophaga sp. CF118]
MKRALYPVAALLIILASAFTFAAAQDWKIGDGYSVKFSASGASGIFKTLKGDISFDEKNLAASKFNVTIDVASINTGNGLKNTHAKGGNWFEAKKYPVITFTSKEITKAGNGYSAKGTLEMHGVKKEITIPFTFARNGNGGTFSGKFDVNRTDFGIGSPGGKVDDIIKLEVTVPVHP